MAKLGTSNTALCLKFSIDDANDVNTTYGEAIAVWNLQRMAEKISPIKRKSINWVYNMLRNIIPVIYFNHLETEINWNKGEVSIEAFLNKDKLIRKIKERSSYLNTKDIVLV